MCRFLLGRFSSELCCVDLEVLNLKGYWLKTPEEVKKSLEKDCTTNLSAGATKRKISCSVEHRSAVENRGWFVCASICKEVCYPVGSRNFYMPLWESV